MVGWHHLLDGHKFEQAPGVSDGQGSLVSYSQWGGKELDMTGQLNWTDVCTDIAKWIKMNESENNWEKWKAFLYSRMLIINVEQTIDCKDTTGLLLLW